MSALTAALRKIKLDAGLNFALSDVFLFAQIPNPAVAIPSALIAFYIVLRAVTPDSLLNRLTILEKPVAGLFWHVHKNIPFLNKIDRHEFEASQPGSTLLIVGVVQIFIFLGSVLALMFDPTYLLSWLAAIAAGLFAGCNIQFGRHMNDRSRVQPHKTWLDVVGSPQFLVAAGSCCSGLMAGLATSFGPLSLIPIAAALTSAALICLGKVGRMKINTGIPMGILMLVAALNTVAGAMNGLILGMITNALSAHGEFILTGFALQAYAETRPRDGKGLSRLISLFAYREDTPRQSA
ncbi:MAG: hypothetical protein JO126_03170 [Alphaproteobacteria bacterium]|nr:hypothetical protein [Alphaproteobacteria bacterium]MBV8548441.1 hypothetical protein [Alphaproteobacteria bacterium]